MAGSLTQPIGLCALIAEQHGLLVRISVPAADRRSSSANPDLRRGFAGDLCIVAATVQDLRPRPSDLSLK